MPRLTTFLCSERKEKSLVNKIHSADDNNEIDIKLNKRRINVTLFENTKYFIVK